MHPLITATYHSTTVAVMNNCFQHCATQFKLMADNSVNTGSFKSRRKLQQMTLLYNCVLVCQLNERCSKNVRWHYVVKFSLKSLVTLTCSLSPSWSTLQPPFIIFQLNCYGTVPSALREPGITETRQQINSFSGFEILLSFLSFCLIFSFRLIFRLLHPLGQGLHDKFLK